MLILLLLGVPILSVLWFLNFTVLLRTLKSGGSIQNQIVIGAILTFISVFSLMYCFVGMLL